MTKTCNNTTNDAFLNGAVNILQPNNGYRAATDPVFLAASIPAHKGQSVLEIGCGVGVALICLGYRIPGLKITGLEIQTEYAELAKQNVKANAIDAHIIEGDVMQMPRELRDQSFGHVIFNPPFYNVSNVSAPNDVGKTQAHLMGTSIEDWILAGMKRLKPKGCMTFIHRAEILPIALGCLAQVAGDIKVKPLTSRQHQCAKRVIVTCRKGTNGPFQLLPPLVIHKGDGHTNDAGAYSPVAQDILRNAKELYV